MKIVMVIQKITDMNKVIRITESDLTRIVKRVLNENVIDYPFPNRKTISIINNEGKNVDVDCELAQTPEEKKQGLLYRDGIDPQALNEPQHDVL